MRLDTDIKAILGSSSTVIKPQVTKTVNKSTSPLANATVSVLASPKLASC